MQQLSSCHLTISMLQSAELPQEGHCCTWSYNQRISHFPVPEAEGLLVAELTCSIQTQRSKPAHAAQISLQMLSSSVAVTSSALYVVTNPV